MLNAPQVNDIIKPFIDSLESQIPGMGGVSVDNLQLKVDKKSAYDLSVQVLVNGDLRGKVVVSLPVTVAVAMSSQLTSRKVESFDQEAQDLFLGLITGILRLIEKTFQAKNKNFMSTQIKVIYGRKIDVTSAHCQIPLAVSFKTAVGNVEMNLALESGGAL